MNKISFDINPICTPISFVRYFISLWPNSEIHQSIIENANSLINQYWELIESTFYSPKTIAISAIIISFAKLQIDCLNWFQQLPTELYLNPDHENIQMNKHCNIDDCIRSFRNFSFLNSNYLDTTDCEINENSPVINLIRGSPVSITATDFDDFSPIKSINNF